MITYDTADKLEALYLELQSATAPSAALDQRLYDLVAPAALEIQGRTVATGFKYTLNVTNALQLRAKKWYLRGIMEIGLPNQPFAGCAFEYMPEPGFIQGGTNANGHSIGLATCAAIARVWSIVVREYLDAAG